MFNSCNAAQNISVLELKCINLIYFIHSKHIKHIPYIANFLNSSAFVWCLTARQHTIGQFVPTAGLCSNNNNNINTLTLLLIQRNGEDDHVQFICISRNVMSSFIKARDVTLIHPIITVTGGRRSLV